MKRKTSPQQAALTDRTTIKVRFSEIDSMQINMCVISKMDVKLSESDMAWTI